MITRRLFTLACAGIVQLRGAAPSEVAAAREAAGGCWQCLPDAKMTAETEPEIRGPVALLTYISFTVLVVVGHLRDFFGAITGLSRYLDKTRKKGYGVLFQSWESFYTRRLYHRIQDCWNRPVSSAPGARIDVMERISKDNNCTLEITGNILKCINIGSYNYLGFADDWKVSCRHEVMPAVEAWPIGMSSSRMDLGSIRIHEELEERVARFVGKEAAVVLAMGYDTNASVIPALMGAGTLIVSDSLNHTSIVNGARAAPSNIRVFRHNDHAHLEEVLREAIVNGQPKHHRPWKKIMVIVEGIYSMEGDICRLPEVVRICKKYKAYIFVDEAHSIGALGKTGRGVCEQTGVNPADIDILMGTFTKSFSGMGGYIAASKEVIQFIKANSPGSLFHNSMPPVICQQIITAFRVIMGEDGTDIGQRKLTALRDNCNYVRAEMKRLGLHVYGDDDSPIIPILIYMPAKLAAFSRECLKRGLAVVVVGFPATQAHLGRSRFCLSAGHTQEDLQYVVKTMAEVCEILNLRYSDRILG